MISRLFKSTPPLIRLHTPLYVGLSVCLSLYFSFYISVPPTHTHTPKARRNVKSELHAAGQFSCRRQGDEINKSRAGSRKQFPPGAWHGMARSCIQYTMCFIASETTPPHAPLDKPHTKFRLAVFSALFFLLLWQFSCPFTLIGKA